MEDYFDGFSEDITKWEIIRDMIDLDLGDEARYDLHKTDPSVQLLPRQDVALYGTIPKMEQRIYTKCNECRLIFNPRDILSHKTCTGRSHSSTQSLKKKVKSKGSSSKKSHSSLPPPPLFKKPPSTPTSTTSTPSITEPKLSPSKVSSKIPKISTVATTSSTHTVTTTTTSKPETRISSSSSHSLKSSSIHSPKSPSKSVTSSSHSPKSSSKTTTNTEMSGTCSTSSSTSSSSSRYKKSRKSSSSSSKVTKEFDPDVHCGVIEGSRGPCTRSITCSNHRIQLRKLVQGRSKDIHQLIAERKAAKEKEAKHGGSSSSYMSPNGEEKDIFCQNTSYVPIVATIVSTIDSTSTTTYVPIMPKTSSPPSNRQTPTSVLTTKQLNLTDMENKPSKTLEGSYIATMHNSSQENAVGTVPVVYMPMGPISVVSPVQQLNLTDMENKSSKTLEGSYVTNMHNTSQEGAIGTIPIVYMPMSPISVVSPVQFLQIEKNLTCPESPQSAMSPPLTATQSLFLTIPSQQPKMYTSHPKPVAMPTYGTKKVGGAILLSNQQIECQRNDILMAINPKRETVNNVQGYRALSLMNHTNAPHRPNILKVKSVNKVNCKRPSGDKLNSSDSKQLRICPNVNGFMLHSDISETADAPQSNNSIQEKIALLNMK